MSRQVEGYFRGGRVTLKEVPDGVEGVKVVVTFLIPEGEDSGEVRKRQMLDDFAALGETTWTDDENAILDDFGKFRREHPVTFRSLEEDEG